MAAGLRVPEPARNAERLGVALNRTRRGAPRAEGLERELQHACAHLGAEPSALPVAAEPRPGVDRPFLGKSLPAERLHAAGLPVVEGDEVQYPRVGAPAPEARDVML